MLIDIDHMSNLAKDTTLTMAERRWLQLPDHGLAHRLPTAQLRCAMRPCPTAMPTARNYGTSDERKLANERALDRQSRSMRMQALGGNIGAGVNTNANRLPLWPNSQQLRRHLRLLHAILLLWDRDAQRPWPRSRHRHRIGWSGRVAPSPFWHRGLSRRDRSTNRSSSCRSSTMMDATTIRRYLIDGQARFQDNGVLYESRLLAPYNARFGSSNGAADGTEREMWLGALLSTKLVLTLRSFEAHCGDCPSFGKDQGLSPVAYVMHLASPTAPKGDGRAGHAWEAVRYVESGGLEQCRTLLTGRNLIGDLNDDQKAKKVWCLWLIMEDGDNAPLSRARSSARATSTSTSTAWPTMACSPTTFRTWPMLSVHHEAHPQHLGPGAAERGISDPDVGAE